MYGGYGGLSSYSSYGGMGSMGSYGGYGGNNGSSYSTLNQRSTQNGQPQQQDPQQNQRKSVFQQWYKMMGGLKSVIQLGFAAIAIANFYSHASEIVKKLTNFLKETGTKILGFMNRTVGKRLFSKFAQPETRKKTIKSLVINFVRVVAVLILILAAKLKSQIKRESQEKLEKLQKQYEECKTQLKQVPESELEQHDSVLQNANL